MTLLSNSFEGGTNGTSITHANSGGTSGTAFDFVTVGTGGTCQYSNTQAAHGSLSCNVATGSTATGTSFGWTTTFGTPTQAWFRCYLFFTANPATSCRFYTTTNTSGTGLARWLVNSSGKIVVQNDAGSNITGMTSTNSIPLNAWFRVEGMMILSATVGQVETKLYLTPDSTTADETDTSAATQATLTGTISGWQFGPVAAVANQGPIFIDDVALSSTGYPLPVVNTITLSGSITTAGTLQDKVGKTLSGTVSTTGALARQVGKTLAGTATTTGSLQRSLSRSLSATVTTSPAVVKTASKTLAAGVTTSPVMVRNLGKPLPVTVNTAGSLARQVSKPLNVTVATIGSVQRSMARSLAVTVTLVPAVARGVSKTFAGSVATAGALSRGIRKLLAAVVGTSGSVSTGYIAGQRPAGRLTIAPAPGSALTAALTVTPAGPLAAMLTITPAGPNAGVLTITSPATRRAYLYPPAAPMTAPPAGPQDIGRGA